MPFHSDLQPHIETALAARNATVGALTALLAYMMGRRLVKAKR